MRIGVTAASGQLGSTIIECLKSKIGIENLVGFARNPEKAQDLGIEIRLGDYDNIDHFNSGLEGLDRLLIISGMDTPKKRIQQHKSIMEAAKLNGVEKIVYTSIIGEKTDSAFGPIISSNRQTERDLTSSGVSWAVGRNGLYIEPDIEFIDEYKKNNSIENSAYDGNTSYTSRNELAEAYTELLLNDNLPNKIYNLNATPISQEELANYLNEVFGTKLTYSPMKSQDFLEFRRKELGSFIGTVVSGIYDSIREGAFEATSDFEEVLNRPHKTVLEMIQILKTKSRFKK